MPHDKNPGRPFAEQPLPSPPGLADAAEDAAAHSPPSQLALGTELDDATALAQTKAGEARTAAGLGDTFQAPGKTSGDLADLLLVPSDNYVLGAEIARGGMGRRLARGFGDLQRPGRAGSDGAGAVRQGAR